MASIKIFVPSLNLRRDVGDIVRFLGCFSDFWGSQFDVVLDLSRCSFLNAEGAAILAGFNLHRREWGGQTAIDWASASYDIKRQLGRWKVSSLFGEENFPWTDNAIPLLHQRSLAGEKVEEYISSVVRAGENMPAMTPDLVKRMNQSLCELFTNIFEHAESSCGGLAIGQYYPNVRQVQFCVCDFGQGIAAKVQNAGIATHCRGAAIKWALEEGNSTKHAIGGLGLFLLKNFVTKNGGTLRILANNGYYDQSGSNHSAMSIQNSYPGTLVQIGLLIRPNEVYTIQERGSAYS